MRWLWCSVVLCAAVCCVRADDLAWWKTAVFYQVYPRSFKDSNGDGVGDLKGVEQMADYFAEIGVNAIWLSPIYTSPMVDFGYDIANFTEIDPIFGTMADFNSLVKKLHSVGVKLVMDFVPNHSSSEHEWFKKSLNREAGYEDFYVWRDPIGMNGTTPLPPNNWKSIMAGSAWEYRAERNQFYLHRFVVQQPDLNYRDNKLLDNMTAVIDFWLDQGVDGFRMDAVPYIYEDSTFPDAVIVSGDGSTWDDLDHTHEIDQPETYTLLQHWADVVFNRVQADGRQRAVFLEVYESVSDSMKYFGKGNDTLEFPFNFNLLSSGGQAMRPSEIKQIVDDWMTAMPEGGVANWVIGNHDNMRVADRFGPEMVDAMNLITGVLPGIKVTFNGEEIGMQDTFVRWDQTVDPSGILLGPDKYLTATRDPERTPMQWDASVSAGFSTNDTTWLPVNPNYWQLNVAAQRTAARSHLKVFQAMAKARNDTVLQRGDYNILVPNNDTLVITRNYSGEYFVLIANMGSQLLSYSSEDFFAANGLDIDMNVVTSSLSSGMESGMALKGGALSIALRPKCAVLLRSTSVTPSTTTVAPSEATTTTALTTATLLVLAMFTTFFCS